MKPKNRFLKFSLLSLIPFVFLTAFNKPSFSINLGVPFTSTQAGKEVAFEGPNYVKPHNGVAIQIRTGRKAILNVVLDRQSFLNRGYTEQDLGRWNNGSTSEKKGVFLSLLNAVQLNNPNEQSHAWFNRSIQDFYRGLSAHFDYYAKERVGRNRVVIFYAYDGVGGTSNICGGPCDLVVVARRMGEYPFTEGGCKPGAIGCYTGDNKVYIKADYQWALGYTMQDPVWIGDRLNLT